MNAPTIAGSWRHIVARNYRSVRAAWWGALTGIVEPFAYLLTIGIGVSVLVGDIEVDGRIYEYTTFVAPAMLASAAMTGAIMESTYNIFGKLHWQKTYEAMTATPVTPTDIAIGEVAFAQMRGSLYSSVFLVAMAALGLIESWWALLALPATMLIGLAFSAVGLTVVTLLRSWQDFELVLLAQVVMFLFSATFYPLSVYPEPIQLVARISPLYHGAALCRDLVLGTPGWHNLGNVAVLLVMAVGGMALAARRFTTLLYA